jgi:hypothetical protein
MRVVRVVCAQRKMTFDIGRPPFHSTGDAGEKLCARHHLTKGAMLAIEI